MSEARSGLLEQARERYRRRDYAGVAAALAAVPRADLLAEPELGFFLADAWRRTGSGVQALELAQALAPICARRDNERLHRDRLNLEGMLRFERGDVAAAEALWQEMLAAATAAGDEQSVARANNNLGVLYTLHCRWDEALATYERALAAHRRLGYRRGLAQAHQNLAIAYREMDFFRESDSHFRRAISYARADGSEDVIGRAEEERALLFCLRGDLQVAGAWARRALDRFVRLGEPAGQGESLRVLGIVALAASDHTNARTQLERALEIARRTDEVLLEAETLEALAALSVVGGDDAAASALREESTRIFDSLRAAAWGARVRAQLERIAAARH